MEDFLSLAEALLSQVGSYISDNIQDLLLLAEALLSQVESYISDNRVWLLVAVGVIFLFQCAVEVSDQGFSRKLVKPFLRNLLMAPVAVCVVIIAKSGMDWLSSSYPDAHHIVLILLSAGTGLFFALFAIEFFLPLMRKVITKLSRPISEVPETPPAALTVSTAPVRAMQLKLRRSRRIGGIARTKVIFALDARVDLSAEEQNLVAKFALGSVVVYESQARRNRNQAAYAHFDSAAHVAGYDASSAGRSLWRNARGLASAAMMALSLRVTVDSLIRGQHIECRDLDELLGAESAIVAACKNLKAYLDTALTFDGREEVLEF